MFYDEFAYSQQKKKIESHTPMRNLDVKSKGTGKYRNPPHIWI